MTRKKGNKWYQRILAGVMSLSLMVLCMLPVSAACSGHVYQDTGRKSPRTTISYNEGNHTTTHYKYVKCVKCKEEAEAEDYKETESHKLNFSDEGHSSGMHYYRGHCFCGFSTLIMMSCGGGGSHATP